jgi:hypothetical protein
MFFLRFHVFPASVLESKEPTENIPRDSVLNMDETGFSDFVDPRIKKIIAPSTYLSESIPIPAVN